MIGNVHDRNPPGVNHLGLHAGNRVRVDALNCSLGKISRAERGIINDRNFIRDYRHWLPDQQQTQIAA